MSAGREKVKRVKEQSNVNKSEKFLVAKMWLAYLVSLTTRDRGAIPENIGNSILITNNIYITKKFLSSVVQLVELSLDTPVTFLGEMIMYQLRKENCTALVDFTIKNSRKDINFNDAGLKSRIKMWESSEENRYLPENDKKRAIRCLYTLDEARRGQHLMESRIFLTIRASNGTELSNAEKIVYKYLAEVGCVFRPVSTSLNEYLRYVLLLSNKRSKNVKTMSSIINSSKTLSQLLPNTHSPGKQRGIFCGTNTVNGTPFRLDLKNLTMARNMYVITNSGGGKTALALNMVASALEEGYHACVMDIKGNEFNAVIGSVGGATISLRENSDEYINTFPMVKDEVVNDANSDRYFKDRFNFSKKQMLILSGVKDDTKFVLLEGFIDEFLNYLYISLGVLSDNRNTWVNTLNLTPYIVYDYLLDYLNEPIRIKYAEVMIYITTNLRMYYSRTGSKSYIFTKELKYKELLDLRGIRFDFGIIKGSIYDATIFKLKFMYMSHINGEYVSRNFDKNIRTFKILEESQAVSEDVMESYAQEYTLRRAQMQDTLLLGNSVSALIKNPKSESLIETTTALFIGKLNKTTADLVMKHFDVDNKEGIIRYMSKHNQFQQHFLLVNNMEPKALSPIIKVQYDKNVKYKILTPSKSEDL